MTNNFRITGDFYVSKAGSDSNDGLTPNTPKATIAAGLNLITVAGKRLVIGVGTYEEAINRNVTVAVTILADGNVTIKGDGTNGCVLTGMSGNVFNITFSNYNNFNTNNGLVFNNCTFRDISTSNQIAGTFSGCKIINFTNSGATFPNTTSCIIINCTWNTGTIVNSYVNEFSQLYINTTTAGSSDYNNILGTIKVGSAGTFQTLADHKTSFPGLNQHSFALQPLFNDVSKEDFTLQATSPHIAATSTGSNIGSTNVGKPFYTSVAPEWQTANGAIWENIVLSGTDLVINTGSTSGRVTSAPMLISNNPVIINSINYCGLLLFNKSKAGGTATNQNVPDATVYPASDTSGGGNPDRLVIEMRWSNQNSMPVNSTDWINGGLLTAGAFGKFPINTQPFVDNSQKGSGEPDFNNSIQNSIVAIWVQFRVTLTNSYL